MSWITLASADVLAQFSAAEKTAYDAVSGADKLPDIIVSVSNQVRGYAAVKNTLGAAGTIPDSLEGVAIAIIRFRFLNGLPSKTLLTDDRRTEYNDALKVLQDVAAGKFIIDNPASGAASFGSAAVLTERPVKLTTTKMKGL